ncbi:hypothetical protein STEG23_014646 [Scotinomys teguina]
MTVTPLGWDQDCSLKIRDPEVPAPFWFLDPGGWSKTTISLYFIFPRICTLSLATFSYPGLFLSPYEVENCSFQVCEELSWYFDRDCIESVDSFWNVPCIPALSKAFIMKGCWILSNAFSASNEMIMCCYISNFISDFINLDALSLPFEKVPWGPEKEVYSFLQKDGPCFVSILLTCVFLLVGKIFFNDFVEYVFCAFELVFFSFFYPYYLKFRPFHGVPDFLDILCYELFGFGVFLDC